MRGEHAVSVILDPIAGGLSPHTRGARLPDCGAIAAAGIIPACAGSTGSAVCLISAPQDHPRMRGEHYLTRYASLAIGGSSPHARGARLGDEAAHVRLGIIPACAGSTGRGTGCRRASWDHPRMRGEHAPPSVTSVKPLGSSPHARGARRDGDHHADSCGIIPACAGSTHPHRVAWLARGDHPRMRGEHK